MTETQRCLYCGRGEPNINDMPPPAEGKRETSKAAAKCLVNIGTWRYEVLNAIHAEPSGSSKIARFLDNTEIINVRPRLSELEQAGFISNTGETEFNRKGNSEIIWRITSDGVSALRNAKKDN